MFQRFAAVSAAALALASLPITSALEVDTCRASAGASLCLTTPDGVLAGDQTISATWSGSGSATVEFTLDGNYLNFEYQKPYSFTWPTAKELDGTHTLAARVHKGSVYGKYVSTSVTLTNGNLTSVPSSVPRTTSRCSNRRQGGPSRRSATAERRSQQKRYC